MKPFPSRLRQEATPEEQAEHGQTPNARLVMPTRPARSARVRNTAPRNAFRYMMSLLRAPQGPRSACRPQNVYNATKAVTSRGRA